MPGDLMDSVFGDIKTKKAKSLRSETLSKESLSDETLMLKDINIKLLNEAIQNTTSKRKMIGVWSPLIAASMWYLKSTIPRFSISDAARAWIEAGLEKEYPELVKKVKEEMGKSNNR